MQVATPNSAISSSTTSSPSVAVAVAVAASLGAGPPGPDSTYTQLILDHPLYPLLEMVFQKCELATSSPRDSQADSICSSDSFSEDIRNFISTARMRNEQLTTGCHDVDKFMLKSIEVLRIHLQELEKVHQLCDNFCTRYINCLKGKLPIDLVVDDGSSRDTNSTSRNGQQDGGPSSNNTTPNNSSSSTNQNTSTSQNGRSTASNSSSTTTTTTTQQQQNNGHHHSSSQQHHSNTNHHHPHQQSHHDIGAASNGYPTTGDAAAAAAAAYHQSYGAYGPTGYAGGPTQNPYAAAQHAAYAASAAGLPHYQPPSDHHSSIKLESSNANHHLHHHPHHRELTASSGSSSASSVKEHGGGANGGQYGTETNSATTAPDRQLHDDIRSPTGSTGSFLGDASLGSGDGTECEDDDNRGRRQQKKRGIFPKAATNIMRAWLFNHLSHPYPSEDQKKQLAEETGLTILQVNNWFINARRRIVQPMIDHSNRSGNMMAGGPAYSPDGGGMGYMLDPSSQSFRSLSGVDSAGMNPLAASHAAMTSAAMGAYSAASAQHLSQYNRQQQSHAAMLGLSTPPTGPHMMGAHPTLPPHDYY